MLKKFNPFVPTVPKMGPRLQNDGTDRGLHCLHVGIFIKNEINLKICFSSPD